MGAVARGKLLHTGKELFWELRRTAIYLKRDTRVVVPSQKLGLSNGQVFSLFSLNQRFLLLTLQGMIHRFQSTPPLHKVQGCLSAGFDQHLRQQFHRLPLSILRQESLREKAREQIQIQLLRCRIQFFCHQQVLHQKLPIEFLFRNELLFPDYEVSSRNIYLLEFLMDSKSNRVDSVSIEADYWPRIDQQLRPQPPRVP